MQRILDFCMPHLVIAVAGSVAIVVIAIFAKVPTYRLAPLFLIPAIWLFFLLRRALKLRWLDYALLVSALLLHMLGAFGYYQQWPLPISFDIVVHGYFAFVVTLLVYHTLEGNYRLSRWQRIALSFFIVMGLASLHEVMEYSSYLLLGEERGMLKPSTSYFFDTQRDLTSNLAGTVVALVGLEIVRRGRKN